MASEKEDAKKWSDCMEELHSLWENNRSTIFETLIQCESVDKGTPCFNCGESPGLIKCHQCGSNWPVCVECDRKIHERKPFHDRHGWMGNHFRPLQPSHSLDKNGQIIEVGMSCKYGKSMLNVICTMLTDVKINLHM